MTRGDSQCPCESSLERLVERLYGRTSGSRLESGNWLPFDMTADGVAVIFSFFEVPSTQAQIDCVKTAYLSSGAPWYFALGIGVAGASGNAAPGHAPFVLAHKAPDAVLANGTGIDHLDDVVVPVLLGALESPTCAALGPV